MTSTTRLALVTAAVTAAVLAGAPAAAQYNGVPKSGMMTKGDMPAGIAPEELKKVDFEQKLGAQVPLDLPFRDEAGKPVQLQELFVGRPVILTLVYYECPMLCTEVLNGLVRAMKPLSLEPGRDFNIITISFNHAEKPALAADKKRTYLERYGRSGAGHGWRFLTGDQASIKLLTDTVGFHFVFDERISQFAHPAGIMVATPEGRMSKYLYGIEYAPRDLRLALVEASDHKIGTPVDRVLLYCFHYDPTTGKYGLAVLTIIRAGGVVTMGVLAAFVLIVWRRDRSRPAQTGGQAAGH